MKMQRNFVTFFSPGTFVAEMTERPIDTWDIATAVRMSREIKERYDATPYGFRFSTRSRGDADLDSKESARSPMYFLGGRIETLSEVEARNDPKEEILCRNMRSNSYDRIVTNDNSWSWTQPLSEDDVVLDMSEYQ